MSAREAAERQDRDLHRVGGIRLAMTAWDAWGGARRDAGSDEIRELVASDAEKWAVQELDGREPGGPELRGRFEQRGPRAAEAALWTPDEVRFAA